MGVAVALHHSGGGGNFSKTSYHLLRVYYMPRVELSPLTLYLICSTQQPYLVGITFLTLDVKKLKLGEVMPLVKCYATNI